MLVTMTVCSTLSCLTRALPFYPPWCPPWQPRSSGKHTALQVSILPATPPAVHHVVFAGCVHLLLL